jgi:hypothetical protein
LRSDIARHRSRARNGIRNRRVWINGESNQHFDGFRNGLTGGVQQKALSSPLFGNHKGRISTFTSLDSNLGVERNLG